MEISAFHFMIGQMYINSGIMGMTSTVCDLNNVMIFVLVRNCPEGHLCPNSLINNVDMAIDLQCVHFVT